MANPILKDKSFERAIDEGAPGWAAPNAAAAAPDAAMAGQAPPTAARTERLMTANGTFARAFGLFLLVLAGGAFGWSQVEASGPNNIDIPGWSWVVLIGAFIVAMICAFRPKSAPFLAPLYAVLEGVFLGVISKVFETYWDGIVLQAVLATVAVFFVTLILYVTGVVKVSNKFIAVVVGATLGIFLMYAITWIVTLFGADITFWNEATPLGIGISIVICAVAALNLFLDYEFIRRATVAGSPQFMEWYGAFGLMVTLVWLYLEILRLLSLLRQ